MEKLPSTLRFGSFELRRRTRELYKGETRLKLRPQPFQVLEVLLEQRGDVVTREELRRLLWSADTFVDFEHGLNTSIKELRGVLNDSASQPRYIETIPKMGYRVIVPVEVDAMPPVGEAAAAPEKTSLADLTGARVEESGAAKRSGIRRWAVMLAISNVLIAAALGGYYQWSRSKIRTHTAGGRLMLAVLPFENLTGDAAQEYFSDGLTEEMIAQLGRLEPERLGVIARTSVMQYKGKHEALEPIESELGVQYVLEGSVRRDAEKIRISAQLIQMKDQTHVWARQYDRELSHVLALQGEIAQDIAGEIRVALGEKKQAPPPVQASPAGSYEAYDLYLRGRYFWSKRTIDGFQRAVSYFQQSIEKDPTYARAYAGLADSYALLSGYANIPAQGLLAKAHAAAQRAVDLDGQLAETHTARAIVAQDCDWDWLAAEGEYRRAIELDPNYATAHHWYAEYLASMGRFDEAFLEIERARQLDPLSLIIKSDYAVILYYSRQYDRAIEQFRAVLEMDPYFPRAAMLRAVYVQKGMYDNAIADTKRWPADNPWYWSYLAYTYGRSGRRVEAQHALRELQRLDRRQHVDPLIFCPAYIGMDQKDEAFASLQQAYGEHSIVLVSLKVDPIYDPLRDDPRFQDLLRRLGLVP